MQNKTKNNETILELKLLLYTSTGSFKRGTNQCENFLMTHISVSCRDERDCDTFGDCRGEFTELENKTRV